MGLVVFGHGQDGNHGDGALAVLPAAGTFVHLGQVGVEVAGVATAPRNFLTGGGDLTESLGVVGDVGEDAKDVHPLLKGQVLGGGQRHFGGGDTLDGRVVGQVDEEDGPVDGPGALKVADEEVGFLEGDTDGAEHHGELGIGAQHLGLTGNLGRQLCVGQTGAGEDGQLLSTDQGVQAVDGGNTGLDEFLRIDPGGRVHGQAVDVHPLIGNELGAAVDGLAHAGENPAQHILGDAQLQAAPEEADLAVLQVDAGGAFKQLDQHGGAVDLQHLAAPQFAVGELDLPQLVVGDAFHVLYQHQGAGDLLYGAIFL